MVMFEGYVDRDEALQLLRDNGRDVVEVGVWTMAYCVAHEDGVKHKQSGKPGDDGRSLGLSRAGVLKCFSGCSFGSVMRELRKGDRQPTQIAAPKQNSSASRAPDGKLVTFYLYKDVNGHLVAEKGRFDPKSFRWRLPGEQNWAGLQDKIAKHEMPLYGIETVPGAPEDEWIIITEGEKARDACVSMDKVAVCSGYGASMGSQPSDWGVNLEPLRGRYVALWADNDEVGFRLMHRYEEALKGIAKAVKWITVPLPEKGDAHDFLERGGDVSHIFSDTVHRPVTKHLGQDHVEVTVPTDNGDMVFDFEGMYYERGAINAELTIGQRVGTWETAPFTLRINLLSISARESLERALKKTFGTNAWTSVINMAYAAARMAQREAGMGKHQADIQELPDIPFHTEQLLPLNQDTIVFGDGGEGKTMWAYALAVQAATGLAAWGYMTENPAGVGILDYETSELTFKMRMARLQRGFGITEAEQRSIPLYHYSSRGLPLHEQIEELRRWIRDRDIKLLIVDSGATACGGPPEASEIAVRYFASLRRLDITTLTICHVAGQSDGMYPFGSRFWHNAARRTFNLKGTHVSPSTLSIGLFNRKSSDGPEIPPLSFEVEFGTDSISYQRTNVGKRVKEEDFDTVTKDTARVYDYLHQLAVGQRASVVNIQAATNLSPKKINAALHSGSSNGIFGMKRDGNGIEQWASAV